MSVDFSCVNTKCDHMQLLERYVIDPFDFKTLHYATMPSLNMRAPINGVNTVKLFVHGTLASPDDPNWGYIVLPDPSRVQVGYTFNQIQFRRRIRAVTPLIEISYNTRQGFCLKCAATGALHDWELTPSGSLLITQESEKMAQQCLKYILTSSNPFNPDLVCPIKTYIGASFGVTVTSDDISSAILTILGRYQAIQSAQRTVQSLDPTEILKDVVSIASQQRSNDPTIVDTSLSVVGYGSSSPVPLNVALKGGN